MGKKRHVKWTKDRTDERRMLVAQYRRQGLTVRQIASELENSKTTVQEDLKFLRSEWHEQVSLDYDACMVDAFAHLQQVRAEAWSRFEDSRTTKRPDGNPRWLEVVRRATSEIIKLLGLDDPVRFAARHVRGEAGTETSVDIVEIVVSERSELEDLKDADGVISLSSFKRRIEETVKVSSGATGVDSSGG